MKTCRYPWAVDQETIRLIVVACGAVTAGLAGALIAGAFNSQNTLATIQAARDVAEAQQEADRDLEQSRWLRDRKVEVYAECLEKARELDLAISAVAAGIESDTARVATLSRSLSAGHLHLYASDEVKEAVSGVRQAFPPALQGLMASLKGEGKEQFEAASQELIRAIQDCEVTVREDLITL